MDIELGINKVEHPSPAGLTVEKGATGLVSPCRAMCVLTRARCVQPMALWSSMRSMVCTAMTSWTSYRRRSVGGIQYDEACGTVMFLLWHMQGARCVRTKSCTRCWIAANAHGTPTLHAHHDRGVDCVCSTAYPAIVVTGTSTCCRDRRRASIESRRADRPRTWAPEPCLQHRHQHQHR